MAGPHYRRRGQFAPGGGRIGFTGYGITRNTAIVTGFWQGAFYEAKITRYGDDVKNIYDLDPTELYGDLPPSPSGHPLGLYHGYTPAGISYSREWLPWPKDEELPEDEYYIEEGDY